METYVEVTETIVEVAESCGELALPIIETAEKIIIDGKVVYFLDASESIVHTVKVVNAGKIASTTNQVITTAMKKAANRGFNATSRGLKMAKVGRFAQKYAGKAAVVLTITAGTITTIKGIANGNGKLIAKGTIGTATSLAAGWVGTAVGAEIGTAICPGIGTTIGGFIGGLVYGLTTEYLVDKIIIE